MLHHEATTGTRPPAPTVTAVVPTRGDRPASLARAVRSVLRQDYEGDVECLVVFDRTRPQLPEGMPLRPGRTLRAVENDRTGGLPGARNTGVLAARAELVAFCDDDDQWLTEKTAKQVAVLGAAPGHDVVSGGIVTVSGASTRVRVLRQDVVSHDMLLRSRLMEVHSSTLLVRRSALLGAVGLFDEGIPGGYGEDYEWLLRASAVRPLLLVPAAIARIELHQRSHFAHQWQAMADATRYLLDRHPDLRRDPRGLGRLYGRLATAEAALGRRRAAVRMATASLRLAPTHSRPWAALAIASGLLDADGAARAAVRLGRGL